MFQGIRGHFAKLETKSRRGFWASIIVMLGMFSFGMATFQELLAADSLHVVVANGLPFFLGGMAAFSVALIWYKRPRAGVWILIISVLGSMLVVPMLAEGYGLLAAVFAFAVTTFIAGQTLTGWQSESINALSAVVAAGIVAIDLYWTGDRIEADTQDVQVATIIASLVLAIYLVVILKQFRSYRLRTKLALPAAMATILLAGLIAVFALNATRAFHEESVGESLTTLARVQGESIGDLLNQEINNLTTLGLNRNLQEEIVEFIRAYPEDVVERLVEIEKLDEHWRAAVIAGDETDSLIAARMARSAVAKRLQDFSADFPDHLRLMVTDRYGAIVATTYRSPGYLQTEQEWWKTVCFGGSGGGEVYIGDPYFDRVNGDYAITIAVPVREPQTLDVIGVLQTNYSLAALRRLLFGDYLQGVGKTELLIPGDIPMVVLEGGLKPVEPQIPGRVRTMMREYNRSYAEVEYGGVPSLATIVLVQSISDDPNNSQAINDLGWLVMIHQATEVANAPISIQTRRVTTLTLIVVGLVSAVSVLLARLISGPVTRLTSVAERIGSGEFGARAEVESGDEIGQLAQTFNLMADQIQDTMSGLELQVAERTRAIELSAEVSRQISAILDPAILVREVVEMLQERFDYYHAQIYLLDDTGENLVMVGGTGEVGEILVEREHSIPIGKGLVGRSCQTGKAVLVKNTMIEADWLPNPLLSDTRAEIAVPIILGEQVVGVLDVQEGEPGGLGAQDLDVLQSIANQVAVAFRNARQYLIAKNRADREKRLNLILQKIQDTQAEEKALQVAVRELGRALGVSKTAVWIRRCD
jgi:putative methionine-R-sulfoxide reductase with GAF domain